MSANDERIVLGAGCFWCVEAVFQRLPGVRATLPGYMGGSAKNPTYEGVCRGDTGHAEVVQVIFDPRTVRLEALLDIFWKMHDPTSLNRQGADVGDQYRSAIFYYTDAQRKTIDESRAALERSRILSKPIVTEIATAREFYPAEEYHRDYFNRNSTAPYCQIAIEPKLQKLGMR